MASDIYLQFTTAKIEVFALFFQGFCPPNNSHISLHPQLPCSLPTDLATESGRLPRKPPQPYRYLEMRTQLQMLSARPHLSTQSLTFFLHTAFLTLVGVAVETFALGAQEHMKLASHVSTHVVGAFLHTAVRPGEVAAVLASTQMHL